VLETKKQLGRGIVMKIVMKGTQLGCAAMLLAALLAGCSGGTGGDAADNGSATPMSLQGVVHGGQAPIVGSSVTLRAASEQGLSNAATVATATTDSNGNFNFSFACPSPTAQMYVTSTGGNPGGGTNTAIRLMALLGSCQSLHTSATINELTTVAAAYAANAFIGPSGCSDCGGGLPQSVTNIAGPAPGLPNAMGNAALLVNTATGADAPSLPTSTACAASTPAPNCLTVKKLNTAANALAACVNSAGPTSAQCVQLFDCATVGAVFTSSTACTPVSGAALPTDTLQAMLNIVRNPVKVSIPGIDDTSNRDVVFSPAFSTHFTDYTMSLNFSGSFSSPEDIAADSAGNIWVSNYGNATVTKLSPNGALLSGDGFAVGAGPAGIAFDANGNAWVANYNGNTLTVLNPAGVPILGSPITTGGLSEPYGIAVSPTGDVWVANSANAAISRFTAAGVAVGTGYTAGSAPVGIAIDASGYVYATNLFGNSITHLSPSGALVNTITDGGMNAPKGAAIDINGNLWVANTHGTNLTKVNLANESEISAASISGGGLNQPSSVAIDAAGNIWSANYIGGSVTELNSAGAALSPSGGFIGAGLDNDDDELTPAVDPSGNVWFANQSNSSVTVFLGAAAPTRTPLVAAISQGFVP
jgi:streptogramin lyase